MTTHFKNLYQQYIEQGIPSPDFGEFKKELSNMPDEELWNTMIDMDKDTTTEIKMPPMVKNQIQKELRLIIWKRRWRQFSKYAAVFALLITSVFGIYSLFETSDTKQMITANVKPGSKSEIILPDGTKVQLNGATTITYNVNNAKERLVQLSGEAFFDVVKNPDCPFRVIANDLQIEVVGTSFNVNAYAEGTWVKTTLVEGRVEAHCGNKNIIMAPGTQVAYNKTTQESDYFPVNVQQFISWKEGYYEFEDMSLEELMQIFTRWYNLNIEFADPKVKEIKFSGRLKRYEDLRPLFEMLEYTRDVNFIIAEDKIIIQRK